MEIGFTNITEADEFLTDWIGAENWIVNTYPLLTGNGSITENTNILTGVGTLFTSELIVGDYIKINDFLVRVETINSDTGIILSNTIPVSIDSSDLYKLTAAEYAIEYPIQRNKIISLNYSYNKIIKSKFYSIDLNDSEVLEDSDLKYAQIVYALYVLNNQILTKNNNLSNQNLGIIEYSLGDMTYKYSDKKSPGESLNPFNEDTQDFLKAYLAKGKTYQMKKFEDYPLNNSDLSWIRFYNPVSGEIISPAMD
jgi:hypothetical protein